MATEAIQPSLGPPSVSSESALKVRFVPSRRIGGPGLDLAALSVSKGAVDTSAAEIGGKSAAGVSPSIMSSISKANPGANTNTSEYRNELEKLLQKTKGTAYESAIKLFIEKKLAERRAADANSDEARSRVDLYHLSSSKYDDQIASSITHPHGISVDVSSSKEQRQKIEKLATPLERQRWKGPFSGYGNDRFDRESTNHVGRQRPGPPTPLNKAQAEERRSRERDSLARSFQSGLSDCASVESSVPDNIVTSSSYYQQALRFRSRSPGVVSVSLDDFEGWLNKNKNWKDKVDRVIESKKVNLDMTAKANAKPKINKKSNILSIKSFERELERSALSITIDNNNTVTLGPKDSPYSTANLLLESSKQQHYQSHQEPSQQSNQMSMGGRSWSGYGEVDTHASRSNSYASDSNTVVVAPGATPSVFVRLALYGEKKKQILRSQFEDRAKSPEKEGTFKPKINDNADKLASRHISRSYCGSEGSRSRSGSPTTLGASHGGLFSSNNNEGSSSPIPPPPPPNKRGSSTSQKGNMRTLSLNLEDLKIGGSLSRSARESNSAFVGNNLESSRSHYGVNSGSSNQQLYVSRRSRSTSRERILEGYEKMGSRSLSAQRKRDVEHGKDRIVWKIMQSQSGFLAPQSEKIISGSRKGETFSDRYYKSVDAMMVRKAIGDRAGPPGPGYYANENTSKLDVPFISPAGTTTKAYRNRSPDRKGHAFTRTPRKDLFLPNEAKNTTKLSVIVTRNKPKSEPAPPNAPGATSGSPSSLHTSTNPDKEDNVEPSNFSGQDTSSAPNEQSPANATSNVSASITAKAQFNEFGSFNFANLKVNTSSLSGTEIPLSQGALQSSTPKSQAILRRSSMLISSINRTIGAVGNESPY